MIADLYYDTKQLINPFNFGRIAVSKYNIGILWTISIEWFEPLSTVQTHI